MKSVLSLDVSKTATAFAFGFPDQVPVTGLQSFIGASSDWVWLKASSWISEQINVLRPDIIAIEAKIMSTGNAGMHTNAATQEVLWGLQTIFRTFTLAKLGSPAVLVSASSARKCLTGRGTYAKGEAKGAVQAACIDRGWLTEETLQADKADALAVWCFMAAQQLPELAFHQPKARKAQPEVAF